MEWASFYDLSNGVPKEVLEKAEAASWKHYVYDATNWKIEYTSSTSGMYGSWKVSIHEGTTVKYFGKFPIGVGSTLEAAFIDFTEKALVDPSPSKDDK